MTSFNGKESSSIFLSLIHIYSWLSDVSLISGCSINYLLRGLPTVTWVFLFNTHSIRSRCYQQTWHNRAKNNQESAIKVILYIFIISEWCMCWTNIKKVKINVWTHVIVPKVAWKNKLFIVYVYNIFVFKWKRNPMVFENITGKYVSWYIIQNIFEFS